MGLDPLTGLVFVFGAAVGSFLNVVVHRLPRGESIAFPPSRCPSCGARIRPRDNVPILGYLALGGRCRACKGRISARYPLVEGLTALLAAALWVRFGPVPEFGVYFVLVAGLVAVTFIDLDHYLIPDPLSLGGVAVGLATSPWTALGWRQSLLGAAAGGGVLLSVYLAYFAVTRREGMGLGDVKLLAAIGAFVGWVGVLFVVFVSSLAGAAVGVAAMARSGRGLRLKVPFGPFLALGAILYVLVGPRLVEWYLGLFS